MHIEERLFTEIKAEYDVAVCGGGVAGIAAALAAARCGKKVVLYFFFVLQTENNSISSTTRNSAIFMSPIVTMYLWYNKCRVRTEFMWDCFVIIHSQLWIIQTAVNFLFC